MRRRRDTKTSTAARPRSTSSTRITWSRPLRRKEIQVPFSSTRRTFLGAAGVVGLSRLGAAPVSDNSGDFKLGVATYSLRKFSRPDAIRMIQDLNTPYVSVKEFHLRYKDSPEELQKGRKEFADAGLKIMSGGV